jgi:hypothetical protein
MLVWKNEGLCFCVDYSELNTTNKGFDDTRNKLTGTMCFSTLDLNSGYWQVALHPEGKEKTAFSMGHDHGQL